MNLEHLCSIIKENYHRLKNKKKALMFLKYHFELLASKRQKLKLGAIIFEIKEHVVAGITLSQEIDIKYIRQDTTHDDELKIENRLKALDWKWDFKNITAFIIVLFFFSLFIYAQIYVWYHGTFPAMNNVSCDTLELKFDPRQAFDFISYSSNLGSFKTISWINLLLVDVLSTFCVIFDIFT